VHQQKKALKLESASATGLHIRGQRSSKGLGESRKNL